MTDEQINAQISEIETLFRESDLTNNEIIVGCAKVIWDQKPEVNLEKIEKVENILKSFPWTEEGMISAVALSIITWVACGIEGDEIDA